MASDAYQVYIAQQQRHGRLESKVAKAVECGVAAIGGDFCLDHLLGHGVIVESKILHIDSSAGSGKKDSTNNIETSAGGGDHAPLCATATYPMRKVLAGEGFRSKGLKLFKFSVMNSLPSILNK